MTQPRLGVTFTPLVPKKPVVDLKVPNRVDRVMRQSGGDFVSIRRTYPAARPWKLTKSGKPSEPKTGPRKGGRRTGQLARNWNIRFGRGSWDVFNLTPYAGYVQGWVRNKDKKKRQTKVMSGRGWRNLDADIARVKRTMNPALRRAFKQSRR